MAWFCLCCLDARVSKHSCLEQSYFDLGWVSWNRALIELSYSISKFNCHFVGLKARVKEQIEGRLVAMLPVLRGLI